MYIIEAKRKVVEKTKVTVFNENREKFLVLFTNGRLTHIYKITSENVFDEECGCMIERINSEDIGTKSIKKAFGVEKSEFMKQLEKVLETEREM